jgi:hypothetical protein
MARDIYFARETLWTEGGGFVAGYSVHTTQGTATIRDGVLHQVGFVWPQSTRRWQAQPSLSQDVQRGFTSRAAAGAWLRDRQDAPVELK